MAASISIPVFVESNFRFGTYFVGDSPQRRNPPDGREMHNFSSVCPVLNLCRGPILQVEAQKRPGAVVMDRGQPFHIQTHYSFTFTLRISMYLMDQLSLKKIIKYIWMSINQISMKLSGVGKSSSSVLYTTFRLSVALIKNFIKV